MVVAPDRQAAIARLSRALDEWQTGGVQTTLPFHRWLVRHPAFVDADLRTDLVARDWDPAALREGAARNAAAAVAAAVADGPPVPSSPAGVSPADGQETGGPAPDGWRAAARREGTERWP